MIALAMLLLMQQAPLQVEMVADVDQVPLGGEFIVTVRATSGSSSPMQITLPPIVGLELVERSERTEVSAGPAIVQRTTVLELRLRGSTAGRWRVGPARVRQGDAIVQADPIQVQVTGTPSGAATASTLSPRVQRLLAQSRPPGNARQASISILLSSRSAYVGEQVDVVTAAWFPRELRLQLRRPPTVQTPSIDGVYAYPQRAPGGIAASRQVDGRWFDLFVVHQVVFPLTTGTLRVPPATLQYSVPLAFQFFSQEERYAVKSEPMTLEVHPVPTAGRPADFAGAVARGLTVERTLDPRSGHAGEPFTLEVRVHGRGNVALWPAPDLAWPPHLRAYSERVSDRIEVEDGILGGTKTFRYLVIPDSARTAVIPALNYSYFDPERARFDAARAPSLSYLVAPGTETAVSRVSPAPLKLTSRPAPARRLLVAIPGWVLVLLVVLPPVGVLVRALPRRRTRRAPPATPPAHSLAAADRALRDALAELVPGFDGEGEALERALRAVGVDRALAAEAAEVHRAIQRNRYDASPSAPPGTLTTRAQQLVPRLRGAGRQDRVRHSISVTAPLVLLAMVARVATAQVASPEQLYQEGALTQAEAGFATRARLDPDVPAHWYNLGATRFRQGDKGGALAAWTLAHRLAPRDAAIRRALRLVPPPDAASGRALWAAPAAPEELWLVALLLWVTGWVGYLVRHRRRWLVVIVAGLVFGGAGLGLQRWYQRPLAIVVRDGSLALSPHELAPAVEPAPVGSVVRLVSRSAGWDLVRAPDGKLGWIARADLEPL